MRTGMAAVAAARGCLGARFRAQGRDVDHGLDCVGVAAAAYGIEAAGGYALRGGRADMLMARIVSAGFAAVTGAEVGDLLLIAAGPAQLHLGVWTGDSLIQAHAGLRRVVETPGRPSEPVIAIFRPAGAGDRQEA